MSFWSDVGDAFEEAAEWTGDFIVGSLEATIAEPTEHIVRAGEAAVHGDLDEAMSEFISGMLEFTPPGMITNEIGYMTGSDTMSEFYEPGGVASQVLSIAAPIVGGIIGGPIGASIGMSISGNAPWFKEGWNQNMQNLSTTTGVDWFEKHPTETANYAAAAFALYGAGSAMAGAGEGAASSGAALEPTTEASIAWGDPEWVAANTQSPSVSEAFNAAAFDPTTATASMTPSSQMAWDTAELSGNAASSAAYPTSADINAVMQSAMQSGQTSGMSDMGAMALRGSEPAAAEGWSTGRWIGTSTAIATGGQLLAALMASQGAAAAADAQSAYYEQMFALMEEQMAAAEAETENLDVDAKRVVAPIGKGRRS